MSCRNEDYHGLGSLYVSGVVAREILGGEKPPTKEEILDAFDVRGFPTPTTIRHQSHIPGELTIVVKFEPPKGEVMTVSRQWDTEREDAFT